MSEPSERANPYVGLRPYFIDDSLYFFGRDEQTAELLEILHAHRFLGIVGSSGSGKSSLVRAGLLPALLGGFLVEERDRWSIVQLRPGDAPRRNLADALLDSMGVVATAEERGAFAQQIADGHTGVVLEFLRSRLAPTASLFLLVDQFEEIFAFRTHQGAAGETDDVPVGWTGTFAGAGVQATASALGTAETARRREAARRRAEAADVVDLLLALAAQREVPIYVALTMRTDFLGDCDLFYGLPEALNRGRYLVPRMTRQQLAKAIAGPARVQGQRMAPRLLDQLLNELGDRFDRLPVLQHALLRTWDAWARAGGYGLIDLEHLAAAGGLEGALEQDAEQALSAVEIGRAERVLRALTDTDISQRQIRRPCRLSELSRSAGIAVDDVRATVDVFRRENRNFLFTSADGNPHDVRVDISHESLIRQWPRLSKWVEAEREARTTFRRIVTLARSHQAGDRDLLSEREYAIQSRQWEQLGATAGWAARYSSRPDDHAVSAAFIAASGDAIAAAKAAVERQRAEAARERRRRTRARIAGAASLIVLLAAGLAFTVRQSRIRAQTIADAGAVVGFVSRVHAALEPIPGTGDVRRELLDNAAGLKARLAVGVRGGLRVAGTEFWEQLQQGDVAKREAQLDRARELYGAALATAAREAASGNRVWRRNLLIAHQSLGDLEKGAGALGPARLHYDSALAIARSQAVGDPSDIQAQHDLAVAWLSVGELQKERGEYRVAKASYQSALAITTRLARDTLPERLRDLIAGYRSLADLEQRADRPDSARVYFEAALAVAQRLERANPDDPQTLADLSAAFASLGELQRGLAASHVRRAEQQRRAAEIDSARALHNRALRYAVGLSADPGGHLTRSFTSLGDVELADDNAQRAQYWYRRALELDTLLARVGDDRSARQVNLVLTYNRLGELALDAAQLGAARDWYGKAVAAVEAVRPDVRASASMQHALWIACTGLGDVASDGQSYAVARTWYTRALPIAQQLAGTGTRDALLDRWTSEKNVGDAALGGGDRSAARAAYTSALGSIEGLVRAFPNRDDLRANLAISYRDLAALEQAEGRAAKGREWLDRAATIERALTASP